jgi:RND family efflux transporter MFP subunit
VKPSWLRVTIACALFVTACSGRPDANAAAAMRTPTGAGEFATVESSTVSLPLSLPAQLYVERDAVIASRTGGVLRLLPVDLGSLVRAGQELAHVDDEAQRLAQTRAAVMLDRARQVAWRAREMRAGNNIPQSEAEDAEFALREAEVNKQEADLALERTALVAPFDGVVTGRYVQPGRLLAVNDSVLRITANGPYLARVRLPDGMADALRSGATVTVRLDDARQSRGTVLRLSPAIDAASGTREAIVRVESSQQRLMAGLAVTVDVPRGTRRLLTVPLRAVGNDGYAVVMQERRTVMRPVVVGDTVGDRVAVLGGLSAGERVRLSPSTR